MLEEESAFFDIPAITESKGGCLQEALRLYDEHGGGEIYWVGILTRPDSGPIEVHHAYYVRPEALDTENALNQTDNGYPEYPNLSISELKEMGQLQKITILRSISNRNRPQLLEDSQNI